MTRGIVRKKVFANVDAKTGLAIAAAVLPPLLSRLWSFARNASTLELRFNSDMESYESVARYISDSIIDERFSRTFSYDTGSEWDNENCRSVVTSCGMSLGYGVHYGRYDGTPVMVDRYIEDTDSSFFKEHLTITFLTRDKGKVRFFAKEVGRAVIEEKGAKPVVPVYINSGSSWDSMTKLPVRALSSVITANNAGERIVDAIMAFESKRDEHHRLGIPHHLGIMLHGEPGCGKTSLIHAVASATGRSIFYLNLGSVEKDKELTSLLSGTRDWAKVILAIEDIDAAGVKVNRTDDSGEDKSPISFSALLNTLDGILSPDGLVVIATTNHRERLDPALLRSGRFDLTIELEKLGREDFIRMAELFGNSLENFPTMGDLVFPMSGADMRALFMEKVR